MHHVGEALNAHVPLHLDAAQRADAPDVVAAQIHQHVVLGPLLFVRQQFPFQPAILRLRPPPGPGARQGEGVQHAVLQLHQGFRRRTGDLHIVAGEVEHVGGGVLRAQRPVDVEHAALRPGGQRIGKHHLEDVPPWM